MTQGPYGFRRPRPDPWSPEGQNWGDPDPRRAQDPAPGPSRDGESYDPSWNGQDSTPAQQPPVTQQDWGNPNWSAPDPAWQPPSPLPPQDAPVQNPYRPNPHAPAPYFPSANPPWGAPGYAVAPPAERHSSKGVVAICLVGAAIVISFILSWTGGQAIVDLYRLTDITLASGGDYPDTAATDGPFMKLGLTLLGQVVPSGLGIAGLIVGALAIRHRNARALGVVSLVLAVLAPFLSFGVLVLAAGPAL